MRNISGVGKILTNQKMILKKKTITQAQMKKYQMLKKKKEQLRFYKNPTSKQKNIKLWFIKNLMLRY